METRKELIYDKINTGMKYNAEFMHAGIEKQQVLSVCHFRSKDNGALRYQNKWIMYLSCYSVFLCSIRPISVCIVRVSWCFSLNLWLAILNFLQSKRIEHFLSLNTRITSSIWGFSRFLSFIDLTSCFISQCRAGCPGISSNWRRRCRGDRGNQIHHPLTRCLVDLVSGQN